MSVMESPLEVLSRAATMVQDNANEARLTTKELPTTKWRRDRRIRTSEYHHSASISPTSPQSTALHQHHNHHSPAHSPNSNGIVRPLSATPQNTVAEIPLDMSVTSGIVKPRSPPPPYREPLPGSTFAAVLAPRPSVITQAPPKRDSNSNNNQNHISISDRENDDSADSESNSEIDEHFRRSLGADYMNLFKKKSSPTSAGSKQHQEQSSPISKEPVSSDEESSEQHSPKHRTTVTVNGESVGSSVDDHFAKALGDTWKKLQADKARNDE